MAVACKRVSTKTLSKKKKPFNGLIVRAVTLDMIVTVEQVILI